MLNHSVHEKLIIYFFKVGKSPTLLYKQALANRTANMINTVFGGFVFSFSYSVVENQIQRHLTEINSPLLL